MRTLYLLRHAKASGPGGAVSDFDRPLTQSGEEAAVVIGKMIAAEKLEQPVVLSSPAARARKTTEIVLNTAQILTEPRFDIEIYEAALSSLIKTLATVNDQTEAVILVGHNPGLESLIRFLTREIRAMSTASLARIDLVANSWKELEAGSGNLRSLLGS